jgi:hypothetical protein
MEKSTHKKLMDGETVNGFTKPQLKISIKFEQIKRLFKKKK